MAPPISTVSTFLKRIMFMDIAFPDCVPESIINGILHESAEVGKVMCVGAFGGWYEETLHPSSEAFRAPCTARATMYCASGLAAFIAAQVANYASDRPTREEMTVDFRNGIII